MHLKRKVYIAVVEHKYGVNTYAADSQEKLDKELAEYIAEWYDDIYAGEDKEIDIKRALENGHNDVAIYLYFEDLDSEYYTDYAVEVDFEIEDLDELLVRADRDMLSRVLDLARSAATTEDDNLAIEIVTQQLSNPAPLPDLPQSEP